MRLRAGKAWHAESHLSVRSRDYGQLAAFTFTFQLQHIPAEREYSDGADDALAAHRATVRDCCLLWFYHHNFDPFPKVYPESSG